MEYLLQDLLKLPLSERIRIIEAMFADIWNPESSSSEQDALKALQSLAKGNTNQIS